MRTAGNYNADTPHQGGWIWMNANDLAKFSANLVLTRNALGDYSLNRTAAGAETYQAVANLTSQMVRLVEVSTSGMPFQEQFGTASGTASYPAGPAGFPPFTGASQLTPPTTPPSKGLQVINVAAVYQVGVVDLTSISLSLNRTVYANNTALAITNIPIDSTAMPKTSAGDATGPYLVTRAVTTPAFEVTDNSDLQLELAFVMANTGTIKLYGLGFHVNFNMD